MTSNLHTVEVAFSLEATTRAEKWKQTLSSQGWDVKIEAEAYTGFCFPPTGRAMEVFQQNCLVVCATIARS